MENKIPTPSPATFYLPIAFWLSAVAYLDRKTELVLNGSGHGIVTMTIKMHKGKIHEVTYGDEIRVREILEKAGEKGVPPKEPS